MTFPATYNISYYYGDTYEFRVFPKNSNGRPFNLDNFDTAKFVIAPTRGAVTSAQIPCYAVLNKDEGYISCAIRPNDATNLNSSTQYVYDVEITQTKSPYDLVYTLLTGNVTVTQDITTPESGAPDPIPSNPTSLTSGTITDTTVQVSWTAPSDDSVVTGYKVAYIPYTTDSAAIATAIENSTTVVTGTSYTFFGLTENTDYSFIILATNDTGDADSSTALTNSSVITTADNPATVEPDFFVTNDGSSAYLVDSVSNDTITLIRGETYTINVNATGHPFWIQQVPAPYDAAEVYTMGVANNGTDNGNITWTVDQSAPDTLFYACQFHSSMGGIISIIDGGS